MLRLHYLNIPTCSIKKLPLTVHAALLCSAKPVSPFGSVWFGGLVFALFLSFCVSVVGRVVDWRWIVASFRTRTSSMIGFSAASFRSRFRAARCARLGELSPLHVCFMPGLLVRVDRSFCGIIRATASFTCISIDRSSPLAKVTNNQSSPPIPMKTYSLGNCVYQGEGARYQVDRI